MFALRLLPEPMKVRLTEKNTFIHVEEADGEATPQPLRPHTTCPSIIQKNVFRTYTGLEREKQEKQQRDEDLHAKGKCRPCAYYAFKKDGCRMGESCEFCHLCDRSQVRRWQRLQAKAMQSIARVVEHSTSVGSRSSSSTA
eukprot:TRINITY_DN113108_c0_g1_i1.p1 TRINITY_DN113108_c0_g1~~TRINITY_DN113108_c0_g1_i1.p1  ORF type:complete len:141 (+),score=30.38 TRINITY_DN113108_c0_g1_i1:83-505(+)